MSYRFLPGPVAVNTKGRRSHFASFTSSVDLFLLIALMGLLSLVLNSSKPFVGLFAVITLMVVGVDVYQLPKDCLGTDYCELWISIPHDVASCPSSLTDYVTASLATKMFREVVGRLRSCNKALRCQPCRDGNLAASRSSTAASLIDRTGHEAAKKSCVWGVPARAGTHVRSLGRIPRE